MFTYMYICLHIYMYEIWLAMDGKVFVWLMSECPLNVYQIGLDQLED